MAPILKLPIMGLIDILSTLIAQYEEQHLKKQIGKGIDAFKFETNKIIGKTFQS